MGWNERDTWRFHRDALIRSAAGCSTKSNMNYITLLVILGQCIGYTLAEETLPGQGKLNILVDDAIVAMGAEKDVRLTRHGHDSLKIAARDVVFSGDLISPATEDQYKRVLRLQEENKGLKTRM